MARGRICRDGEGEQVRAHCSNSFQHGVTPQGVKGIFEVQLHKGVTPRFGIDKSAGGMDRSLCPPLTPTPNWRGESAGAHTGANTDAATLATNLRKVSPTAIGLTPPPLLGERDEGSSKKTGRTGSGTPPDKTRFTKEVRESAKSLPVWKRRSLRCCDFRPSFPPAEPGVKLLTASLT